MTSSEKKLDVARLPGLDGLRAVCILLVLLDHWYLGVLKEYQYILLYTIFNGEAGVRIFFVISGFLITRLVLKDIDACDFSFRDFYVKRFAKLFPVLFLYVAILCLFNYFNPEWRPWFDYIRGLFFLTVHPKLTSEPALAHTWSLSVEEVFYVILVPLICLLHKRAVILTTLLSAIIFISMPITALNWQWEHIDNNHLVIPILGDLGPIAIGSLFAMYNRRKDPSLRNFVARHSSILLGLGLSLTLIDLRAFHRLGFVLTAETLSALFTSIGACCLISYCLYAEATTLANRILNHPIALRVGLASYSIYVFQQIFFWEPAYFQWSYNFKLIFSMPLSILCGLIVFHCVEKRFNRGIRAYFKV